MSAMVVGVCTHPEHKNQGYASVCMTKLCQELLAEGKMLCLFYDNPEAGSIYKRLGFEDIGKWMMHVFHPVEQVS
ncbi:GNAT family N-acetyltransferase [Halobacillus sp. K22]|uniref:GNAT family N-acetyltransferase n=1 Tax=Halobacillus sp. K22 TaxID=3457431 RepID=UPI003FCD41E0